jgi:hypothetical protein
VALVSASAWLGVDEGADADGPPSIDDLAVRYLRAYGPATVADLAAFTRLTGLRVVLERLPLVRYRDERGRELFDVEDGLLPGEDVPAPVRLLPEYDNCLLAHADRSRFGPAAAGHLRALPRPTPRGTVLVDGLVAGTWHLADNRVVTTVRSDEVDAEAAALTAFLTAP